MAETPLSTLYSNSRGGQCLTIVGTEGVRQTVDIRRCLSREQFSAPSRSNVFEEMFGERVVHGVTRARFWIPAPQTASLTTSRFVVRSAVTTIGEHGVLDGQ